MRVYHFTSAKYALENIKRRRVKLATINDLNDPFELSWLTSPDPAIRKAIANSKKEMHSIAGLLCFSRNWSNPVQWGHYADRHRGICLGFDVPPQFLMEIEYTAHRRVLTETTAREIKDRLLRTKFSHWRYEKEMRLFEDIRETKPDNGLYFKPFSGDLTLSEVIIGPKSAVTRRQVTDALGDLSGTVKLKNSRLSFQRFAVVTQRDPQFWK